MHAGADVLLPFACHLHATVIAYRERMPPLQLAIQQALLPLYHRLYHKTLSVLCLLQPCAHNVRHGPKCCSC